MIAAAAGSVISEYVTKKQATTSSQICSDQASRLGSVDEATSRSESELAELILKDHDMIWAIYEGKLWACSMLVIGERI